jgi:hypothetical protein
MRICQTHPSLHRVIGDTSQTLDSVGFIWVLLECQAPNSRQCRIVGGLMGAVVRPVVIENVAGVFQAMGS